MNYKKISIELIVLLLGLGALVTGICIWLVGWSSMPEFYSFMKYLFIEGLGLGIIVCAGLFFIIRLVWKVHGMWMLISLLVLIMGTGVYMAGNKTFAPHFAMPMFMHTFDPHQHAPFLPLTSVYQFFMNYNEFERVADISRDPNDVPKPLNRTENETVKISIVAQEVLAEIAPGITFNYWTYDKTVPGPMFRVVEGDIIELSLTNHESSLHRHNIDLHAVTGPGGGATLSSVKPGETKTFTWAALNPGLYVYHCATANISSHNSHGQYGLILVEPKGGLSEVDKEFYVMQGELYTEGELGKKGLAAFDGDALIQGDANYVTFNGKIESVPRMKVQTGDRVRIYVGNGGVNYISSFHVIGEIFDKVYIEGGIGTEPNKNIQTTAVLPGGSSIVEFTADVPGDLILVDHALARMNKGAWAIMEVEGEPRLDIYAPSDQFIHIEDTESDTTIATGTDL